MNRCLGALPLLVALPLTCTAQGVPVELVAKLTVSGDAGTHLLGSYVALDGDVAYAGAQLYDARLTNEGSGFLFDTATGAQLDKLLAPVRKSHDRFGAGDLDGDFVLIGANGDDELGQSAGAAYLFNTVSSGPPIKLYASDADRGDSFGSVVAISQSVALVGAYNTRSGGSAYLFDAETGVEQTRLTPDDQESGDRFGDAVAIDRGIALVGAVGAGDRGDFSGAAYLFDVDTGLQLSKLTAPDGAIGDYFGHSVAIDGSVALVGAWRDDDKGSAYLFDVETGNLLHKLQAFEPLLTQQFGWSVSISGGIAAVGAPDDFGSGNGTGAAYLFDVATGTQLAKVSPADGVSGDDFGRAVAISGSSLLVGSRSEEPGLGIGSAYLYRLVPEPASALLAMLAVCGTLLGRRS